jgi:hypothetical protein
MTQFKGSKGKWLLSESKSHNHETKINTKTHRICEVKHYDSQIDKELFEPTKEEGKYNALLISKAPELLGMLEDIVNYGGVANFDKIKQLIKEATEL